MRNALNTPRSAPQDAVAVRTGEVKLAISAPQDDVAVHAPEATRTISDHLAYFPHPQTRATVEEFRLAWERENGPVDLTRRYTSQLPPDEADWLIEHDPKRYFDGLPEFVKWYLRELFKANARNGSLDSITSPLMIVFVSGGMNPGALRRRER